MISFGELIDINSLKEIAENIYALAKIPMHIVGVDGSLELSVGWQDICTNYHRVHPITCKKCLASDKHSRQIINGKEYISYKCLNNMREIGIPIIISGMHVAYIFLGQFFYDTDEIDMEYFRTQALECGFDEKDYLEALSKVPIYSEAKIKHVIAYFKGLITILSEGGLKHLEYTNSRKELEKSREYLDTIFNLVNDAIFITNFSGNILDVNETAVSMFGYSKNELLHMSVADISKISSPPQNYRAIAIQNMDKVTSPTSFERKCINKNNDEFWVEINVRIANIDGNERILGVVRNVTERKQAELISQNEAIELEKLKTEFFANISHELRTPLNIMLSSTKINSINLHSKTFDKNKLIKNINIERQNCFRLLRLINNLIDSTKLDSGYFELNLVNCNITNIIEDITESVSEYVHNDNLTLTFDTDVEEKIIACDLDKIEKIMLNLLSNSIKFSEPGGNILVKVCNGEKFVTILIEDNGIGIPSDKLDLIFDKFRQVDKSFTRNQEGSGIGLSLVKSFVEIQGGTIDVESKCGIGTKFIIKLPIRIIDDAQSKENSKLFYNNINNHKERIKVEFSDIYDLC